MLQIVGRVLRQYRARLPHSLWLKVCLHCIHAVEETLLGMEKPLRVPGSPNAETNATNTLAACDDAHTPTHHDKQTASVVHTISIMLQQTLCVLHAVTCEPCPRRENISGRCLNDVRHCIVQQTGIASCVYVQGLLLEPVQWRQIVLQPPRSQVMVLPRVRFR